MVINLLELDSITREENAAQTKDLLEKALSLCQKGDFKIAFDLCEQVIQLYPRQAEAMHLKGLIAVQTKDYSAAVTFFDKALTINSRNAKTYYEKANVLSQMQLFSKALDSYDMAIELDPQYADAYSNRGVVLAVSQRYELALDSYKKAISINPLHVDVYFNQGNTFLALQQYYEAIESYGKAIELNSGYADAYGNQGVAYMALKLYQEALDCYNRAIEINPLQVDAWNNRSYVFLKLNNLHQSLLGYDRAIVLNPMNSAAYFNRGRALAQLHRYAESLDSYNRSIDINPENSDVYGFRGVVLSGLERYSEAIESYNKAIELNSDNIGFLNNKGDAFYLLRRYKDAADNYGQVLFLNPKDGYAFGMRLLTKMNMCDWRDIEDEAFNLAKKLKHRERILVPFTILAIDGVYKLQQEAAEILVNAMFLVRSELPVLQKYNRHKKIRIGYFSADFYNHATAFLMAEMFELHDRSEFEFIAFSFGPNSQDEYMRRISKAFDRFVDVRNLSDVEVAEMSRALEIDVAIDLKGYTHGSRTGVFALKVAPIQVNYLGYPGTMGADYIDYIIADPILIPERNREFYTEKIVYLPDSYQVNDSTRVVSEKVCTREEMGLPPEGFVFCCFNNNFKITPLRFDGWMRILGQVEGSVLWLLEDNETASANLRMEAVQRGVNPNRLIFAGRLPNKEHLARQKLADLFLDTFPCNAHTTASDALWVGLPILTRMGESFASRVAASLLNAIHLPELITTTEEEYEALAVELALNSKRLKRITRKLKKNRLTTPLFNTERFTRKIEEAYTEMYRRYQNDLPPDHIHIPK